MNRYKKIAVLVSGLICFAERGVCQENKPDTFLYDPIFWGENLKLTHEQKNKIQEINSEFYAQVITLEKVDNSYHAQLVSYVQTRSDLIYQTFRTKQKRRWDKIVEGFSSPSP